MSTKSKPPKGGKTTKAKPAKTPASGRTTRKISKARRDSWTRHRGGGAPVKDGTLVEVRLRDGRVTRAEHWIAGFWKHAGDEDDVMAWRRVRRPKAQAPEHKGRDEVRASLVTDAAEMTPGIFPVGAVDVSGATVRVVPATDVPAEDMIPLRLVPVHDTIDYPAGPVEAVVGYKYPVGVADHFPNAEQAAKGFRSIGEASAMMASLDDHLDGDADGLGCIRGTKNALIIMLAIAWIGWVCWEVYRLAGLAGLFR